MVTEEDVKHQLKVILADKKAYTTSLNWAVKYVTVGLCLTGRELKVQCLYILNNITHWRGEGNKEVRRVLKAFVKGL